MDARRPEMLYERPATPDPAIRDFLKIPHDDADAGSHDDADGGDGDGVSNWKPLRDRLRLRRAANAWQASLAPKAGGAPATRTNSGLTNRSNKYNYSPGEAAAAFSRGPSLRTTPTFSRVSSTRVGPNSSRSSSRRPAAYEIRIEDHEDVDHDEDDNDGEKQEEEEGKEEAAPAAQMSLMALLEQTDSWDDDEDEEGGSGGARKDGGGDDDDDDGEGREEEMVHVCCVCMVRHKGAAFIPCGHTFCRLCSRELWVSRGNCPLCNGFIQEILDIF